MEVRPQTLYLFLGVEDREKGFRQQVDQKQR